MESSRLPGVLTGPPYHASYPVLRLPNDGNMRPGPRLGKARHRYRGSHVLGCDASGHQSLALRYWPITIGRQAISGD
jgi:hypothetical protein